jgi:nicotinate dehydrogenase subunit A
LLKLHINGAEHTCSAPDNTKAIYVLRNDLGLRGVKLGCAGGHCGACTVLVDGQAVNTCDMPLWALEGKQVITPEGLGSAGNPHPVQAALMQEQPGQCGFCLPGIMMTAAALMDRPQPPTEAELLAALDRHLCRCGSHASILRALKFALHNKAEVVQ